MSEVHRSTTPPRSTHASYHPDGYGVSEGLKRARRPFFWKNTLTGGAILGFAAGVYFYSISKVKQDDFSDLATLPPSSNNIQDSLASASQKLSNAASSASSQASASLSSAQSKLSDLSQSAQVSLSRLAERAQASASDARDQAVRAGRDAKESVRAYADNVQVPRALEPKDDARNRLRELILIAQGRSL
ncbi:hypothetical protein OC845_004617 [Tilletia horrida]|nr:hypothetical protein OC845_004617 [Tilletia horrida]